MTSESEWIPKKLVHSWNRSWVQSLPKKDENIYCTRSHHPLTTFEKRQRFWMFLVTIFRSNDQIIQAPTGPFESLGFSHSNASDPQAPHHRQQKRMKIAPNLWRKQIKRVSINFGGQKKASRLDEDMMLRKFPALKNPSDLKTIFSLELCLFIKTSWRFGAPKIPRSVPILPEGSANKDDSKSKLSPLPLAGEIPGNHPQRKEGSKKTPSFWLGLFFHVFPMKRAFGIAHILHKAPPSIRPYPGCCIHLPSKAGAAWLKESLYWGGNKNWFPQGYLHSMPDPGLDRLKETRFNGPRET